MKKVILCSCLVAALLCCLIVPSFAANWFGSQSVISYSVSIDESAGVSPSDLIPWLMQVANRTIDSSASVESFTATDAEYATRSGKLWYNLNLGNPSVVVGGYSVIDYDVIYGSTTIDSDLGYTEISSIAGVTVTPVTSGVSGFVTNGFTSGLGIAGTVVNFCISNTYVLIAIGFAVAVPLVGWGISKLKSLIKGY